MQLFSMQSKLIWLLVPTVAMAASPLSGGLTAIGTGQLNLVNPQNLSATPLGRAIYCKHDDDPYRFISSLNYTFPSTPSIPESFLASADLVTNQDIHPFDCFLELPGGIIVFELKGEIDSDLTLVFEVWVGILAFNYKIGPFRCNLLDLEKDPCTFDIHLKYLDGQGGIYPEEFPDDPGYVHLCLKVYGKVQIPYTRVHKNINFDKCFYRFPKPDDTVDADA